ncbi:formamidopyrimidine-DNA glycosylase [Ruminiclostridium cellobioparum]|uniref:Formamidopyrimidine-DNA glycosylase n=1 Tax=Ruminiclostridium cellobioparum subsp. termitidis CT1112 TaxID=1195236 RepID=S0FLR8_RUMCE|nr:formamidopyrimidine-DNA glycosylase [Ruminiclostridium cellobioparum]EMS73180.1 Formamidopyrimidine-DNA glycosylase [Ruminiclostridium cellobioparum subsp. termitidis CT1112]
MIEIPEALELSRQIRENITGKRIMNVISAQSPHKFAWYFGDPDKYHGLLSGKIIGDAKGVGGMVEITAEDAIILLGDGVAVKYHGENEKRPQKHQLLIEFDDFTALTASVQMYGGLWCFRDGTFDNQYYNIAKVKPSVLSSQFDEGYFDKIVSAAENAGLSAKALLATEQRIPGLGNGVLQDILYNAEIHPRKKVRTFSPGDKKKLFLSVKNTLAEMTFQGGRDTEKDLFGCSGGYKTKLSKNTVDKPCLVCGDVIRKEAYLGGSIYYCPTCQKL